MALPLLTMPPVSAHVLTYRSPESLRRCLDAIDAQTTAVAEVVIVDNDGGGEVADLLSARRSVWPARVVGLECNLGPAGGHARNLQEFAKGTADWCWVMDDDVVPDPDALETMMAVADGEASVYVTPVCRDADTGKVWGNSNGWLGVLIPRRAVDQVGGPNPELFWWTEDTEYLQWRLPHAGFERVEPSRPTVEVARSRTTDSKPPWKYYYETRNQIHYRLRVQRPTGRAGVPWHLSRRVRVWRAVRATTKLAGRAAFRESTGRGRRLAMVGRGAADGIAGRLGRRVEPVGADRPDVAALGVDRSGDQP